MKMKVNRCRSTPMPMRAACDAYVEPSAIDRTKKREFHFSFFVSIEQFSRREREKIVLSYRIHRRSSLSRSSMLTVTPRWDVPYRFKGAQIIRDPCPWTDLLKDKLLTFRIGKQQQSLFGSEYRLTIQT